MRPKPRAPQLNTIMTDTYMYATERTAEGCKF
jgi:hypothetical protein